MLRCACLIVVQQGVAKIAHESTEKEKMLGAVNSKTSSEHLYVSHSVKELLIDGYDAPAYQELGTEYNGAMTEGGGDFNVPEYLMDGKYALFENVILFLFCLHILCM